MTGGSWPDPGVPERQLPGGPMRTAGFRRGDRKAQDPQSTHRRRSRCRIVGLKAAVEQCKDKR